MEKIWLKNYPQGVPENINLERYSSLVDLLQEACHEYKDNPALESLGTKLTYQEFWQRSTQLAAFFQQQLKLAKGDRIALMMPNVLQYPIAMAAALRLGLVIVNINPLYTERELLLPLKDSGAKAIIVLANFAAGVVNIMSETALQYVIVTEIGDEFPTLKRLFINNYLKFIKKVVPTVDDSKIIRFSDAMRAGAKETFGAPNLSLQDLAFLQYTGGTTGTPKGAMLTHRNMIANVLQSIAWIEDVITKGEETIVTALPLYHIFSLTVCAFAFLKLGALSLLIPNPRDLTAFIKQLQSNRFTVFIGVNTLYQALMHHAKFKELDFSHLKLSIAGGMPIMKPVAEKWQQLTGKPIIMGYGLTEASPIVTINPLSSHTFTGSIGLPIPSTNVRIVDEANQDVPLGNPGELLVAGPQVMAGYWHQREETDRVLSGSWLHTGDIVTMDQQGYIYIIDRKKDIILVSGFNVYPNEVEEVITSHPGILEAAVIGVPNEQSGETVKAFIVKKDESLTEEAVREYCKKKLTGYKQPKLIEFRRELPKSNIGKILKRSLREMTKHDTEG